MPARMPRFMLWNSGGTATRARASKKKDRSSMKTQAAVAWKAGAPLTIETLDLQGPREGEVLVEIKATGICHTDYYTLSGADPEGLFPAILGHEGAGVVVDVGPSVKSLRKGPVEDKYLRFSPRRRRAAPAAADLAQVA